MAHCSAAELTYAVSHVENIAQLCGWDYHISYDVLFEGLRHHLIDIVSLLDAKDNRQLLGLRDLLTSLKIDSGECVCTGQFSLYRRSFQELIRARHEAVRALGTESRLLHSIALDGGAAKWGLIWLRSEYRKLGEDFAGSGSFSFAFGLPHCSQFLRIASAAISTATCSLSLGSRWPRLYGQS
eukprot:s5659_g2.t1